MVYRKTDQQREKIIRYMKFHLLTGASAVDRRNKGNKQGYTGIVMMPAKGAFMPHRKAEMKEAALLFRFFNASLYQRFFRVNPYSVSEVH